MNVPKLRFKEFNDEWQNKKIDELFKLSSGSTPATTEKNNYVGDINWISSGELKSKYINKTINCISKKVSKSMRIYPKGTLLIALYGLEAEGVRGTASILNIDSTISQACMAFEPLNNNITNEFMYYWYKKNGEWIGRKIAQGTKQQNLTSELVKPLIVNYPQIIEQNKIEKMLSLLDRKIEFQSKKIEDLKLFKKGLHDKLLNEVTGDDYPLSDIAVFENGKGHENIVDENGKYILINSKFVSTDGNVTKKCSKQLTPLFKNDITMVMSDLPNGKALAKCYYIDENNKYSLNQRICKIKVKDDSIINSKYLFYLLNRNSYYLRFDDGVNQTNLKKDDILSLNLVLPSIKDQERDSKTLTIIDNIIEKENNKLSRLNLLKKGLMQNMFV